MIVNFIPLDEKNKDKIFISNWNGYSKFCNPIDLENDGRILPKKYKYYD